MSGLVLGTPVISPQLPDGSGGKLLSIPITNGGSNYGAPPLIRIAGGGGSGATAIAVISAGVVTQINITNPGVGYTSAPGITIVSASQVAGSPNIAPGYLDSGGLVNDLIWLPPQNCFIGIEVENFGAACYLMLFDANSLPANGAVPSFPPKYLATGTSSVPFSYYFTPNNHVGIQLSNGLVAAISTTPQTLALATASSNWISLIGK